MNLYHANLVKPELLLLEFQSQHSIITVDYKRHFVKDSEDRSKLSVLFLLYPEGYHRAQGEVAAHILCHYLLTNFVGLRHQSVPIRFSSLFSSTPESGTFLAPCQRIQGSSRTSHHQSWCLGSSERLIWVLAPSCGFTTFSSYLSIPLTSGYCTRNRRNSFPQILLNELCQFNIRSL